MPLTVQHFTSRIPASAAPRHKETIETAIALANGFEAKAREIGKDARYSALGRTEAIKSHLEQGPKAHLAQLKASVEGDLNAIRGEMAATVPKAPDKGDLFGEMQRAEIRTYLRSLPEAERIRVALTSTDETVRAAILFSPAALSGLRDEVRQQVEASYLETVHGSRLAELAKAENALLEVAAAIEVASAHMHRTSTEVPQ